jgi:hypothetical protein
LALNQSRADITVFVRLLSLCVRANRSPRRAS